MREIKIFESKNVYDYRPVFEGLVEDFGYIYYHAILRWCGILKTPKDKKEQFWKVYLIKEGKQVVGICGLYSQYPGKSKTRELWLGWFGIIPSRRNSGIGTVVLQQLEAKAKKYYGCKAIYSYVDKEGNPLSFYYRNGYKRISSVSEYLVLHPKLTMENFEGLEDHVIEKKL